LAYTDQPSATAITWVEVKPGFDLEITRLHQKGQKVVGSYKY